MARLLPDFPKFRNNLKLWNPKSYDDATEAIHLISAMDAAAKELKDRCYVKLDELGEEEYTTQDGFTVKKFTMMKKVYNPSPEIDEAETKVKDLEAKLKTAKDKLQKAKDAAGFDEEFNYSYWQARK